MRDAELIADLLQYLPQRVREEIESLSPGELFWQPDNEGNNIAVTVWHFSRWLDMLCVRALQNRPRTEERWYRDGWATKTGYDPAGIGYAGLGVLTGYTPAEVAAVPLLPAEDLLTYLDQVCTALSEEILALPDGALHQPVPGLGAPRTAYNWLRTVIMGSFGHVGEIEAIKALYSRAGIAAQEA